MPLVVNATILNPMSVAGTLQGDPVWTPDDEASDILDVTFSYPAVLWPWTGYLSIHVTVKPGQEQAATKVPLLSPTALSLPIEPVWIALASARTPAHPRPEAR